MSTSQREQIQGVVLALAREVNPGFPMDSLTDSAHLDYDLGLGSLERLELVRRLEQALGKPLPGEIVLRAHLLSDLYPILQEPCQPQQEQSPLEFSWNSPRKRLTPANATTLSEVLQNQAETLADQPAIIWLSEGQLKATRSYAQLWQDARRAAAGLAALEVKAGQPVALMLPTGTDFLATLFATWLLGAVPVPLYPPFRPDQVEEHVRRQSAILRSAGVQVLVIFPEIKPAARLLQLATPGLRHLPLASELFQHGEGNPQPQNPRQLALIQYTSGSTGHPKGVMLSHSNLLANIRAFQRGLALNSQDVCVTWLPLYHDMGLIGTLLGGLYHAIPTVMMGPQDFLARPSRWLWAIHHYRGTISAAPNFAYDLCAQKIPESETQGLDLSSWRVALNGAETVRQETLQRFQLRYASHGLRPETLMPVYGLAEATLAVTFPPQGRCPVVDCVQRARFEQEGRAWPGDAQSEDCLQFVSCGRPLESIEVRIVGDSGRRLDDRLVGQVQFRSPASLQGYYNNPKATAETLQPDGWVNTGDRGYLADGELYLVGRSKNVILKAGRNLHAEDVEEASYEVPGVRRGCSAAFALADPESGTEQLVLVVETRQNSGPDLENALRRHLQQVLGVAPDRVVVVPPQSVPKTPSGKIRRPLCRQLLLEGSLGRRRGVLAQALNLVGESLRRRALLLLSLPGQWLMAARWYLPLFCLGVGLLLLARLHSGLARRLASACCRWLLGWAGIQLHLQGAAPGWSGPCLLVANHTSRFDPLLMLAAWPQPLRFVVAPWVAQGLLKPLMEALGALAVRRGSATQSQEEVERLQTVFQKGDSLAAFPEGGLEHAPGLRPFTLGVFLAAARAGIPVVAVALRGARELMPDRRFLPRQGRVTLTFSEPLRASTDDWSAGLELARRARQFIAEHCAEPLCEHRLRRED